MQQHLPILLIVVPLAAAPLCVLVRQRTLAMSVALVVVWSVFAMAMMLLCRVLQSGPVSYALGGWAAPWGIEYWIDTLSAFVVTFVSGVGAVVLSYAPRSIAREIPKHLHYLFCAAYLLCLAGLLGIVVTRDLFNLFVFLEISSLSSYALIALGPTRRALTASFQYLVMGTIGATFILIGIGLLLMLTGTLNMVQIHELLPQVGAERSRVVLVAAAFLTVGVGLKMALFPLHLWLPGAYTYSPSVVGAFLAATATKVSVYVFLRLLFSVFGRGFTLGSIDLPTILLPLALLAMFVASTVAIFQTNVKRMLAYSSVAQIGYMVLGISIASPTGVTACIVQMFNHALIKGGLFLATGCIAWRLGTSDLRAMRGIGRRMPISTGAWLVGGLGLIGVPVTAGFIGKWTLVSAALEKNWWPVAAALLLSSLLAVVYVWRVVETFYFQSPEDKDDSIAEAPWAMLLPTCLLIGATIYFGLFTTYSLDIARQAALELLGGLP